MRYFLTHHITNLEINGTAIDKFIKKTRKIMQKRSICSYVNLNSVNSAAVAVRLRVEAGDRVLVIEVRDGGVVDPN